MPELSFLHSMVEIDLDAETIYASYAGTATPTQWYEGRVLSISPITRSIPVECGLYNVSNVTVVLSNHDRYLSHRKASEAWLNRTCRILMGYPDLGLSTFEPAFTGIISEVVFESDKTVALTITDDALGRLDVPITDVLARLVPGGFPDATPTNAKPDLIPIMYGTHEATVGGGDNVGQLPARRINGTSFAYYASHGEVTVNEVYIYGVLAELSVDYVIQTFTPTGGGTYTGIVFTVDPQDLVNHIVDEIEVSWNGVGIDYGDGFGTVALLQLKHLLVEHAGFEESEFDAANLALVNTDMLAGDVLGAWSVIDARLSLSDVVAEAMNSWGCRLYRTRAGLIAFSFLGSTATAVEDFRESNEIIDGSFRIPMNPKDSTASRLQTNFDWNYVREFYARQPDLNSPSEETNLRYAKRRNKSLRYVRTKDGLDTSPLAVGALYMGLMGENIQFPEFDVPARFFSAIDLGDAVTVTHADGIGASGYVAQRVIVLSMNINPDPQVSLLHIRGYVAPEPSVDLSATFNITGGLEAAVEAA